MLVTGAGNLTVTVPYNKCHITLASFCSASILLGILSVRTRNSGWLMQENGTLMDNLIIHCVYGRFFGTRKQMWGKKNTYGNDRGVTVMWNLLLNCPLTLFSLRIWRQLDNVKFLYCLQVHFPSMTVFKNFPGSTQSVLAQPQCLDFSPGSGYLAVGNNKGTALLYR
jgi:hypothetical protein